MPTAAAWLVHLLTASGAVLVLFAAVAAVEHQWTTVFWLLGIAFIVDGVDGPLARFVGVRARLPSIDGAILDLVVDYGPYVLVPAIVLLEGPLLSPPYGAIAAVVVALTGVFYFADTRMKTGDAAFRGFPGAWNMVVLALMLLQPPEAATLAIVTLAALLTFAPVEFVHPLRVHRWRPLTLAMTASWGGLAITALLADLNPPLPVTVAFGMASLYLAAVGAVQQITR